jgi:hypothetical protein
MCSSVLSVCGLQVPIRRRGKVNSKEQLRKRRLEPWTHCQPLPRAGRTLTLGSEVQELSTHAQTQAQGGWQNLLFPFPVTTVNHLFYSGLNFILKKISSNITQSQLQELYFKGIMSALFNFVRLNSTMVCTAESFYPFNAPMKWVPSTALSVLYGAIRKTYDCFQKAYNLLTCSRWNNQMNRISSSMS